MGYCVNFQKYSEVGQVNRTQTNSHQKTRSGELIIATVLQHTGHSHSIKTKTWMKNQTKTKSLYRNFTNQVSSFMILTSI